MTLWHRSLFHSSLFFSFLFSYPVFVVVINGWMAHGTTFNTHIDTLGCVSLSLSRRRTLCRTTCVRVCVSCDGNVCIKRVYWAAAAAPDKAPPPPPPPRLISKGSLFFYCTFAFRYSHSVTAVCVFERVLQTPISAGGSVTFSQLVWNANSQPSPSSFSTCIVLFLFVLQKKKKLKKRKDVAKWERKERWTDIERKRLRFFFAVFFFLHKEMNRQLAFGLDSSSEIEIQSSLATDKHGRCVFVRCRDQMQSRGFVRHWKISEKNPKETNWERIAWIGWAK